MKTFGLVLREWCRFGPRGVLRAGSDGSQRLVLASLAALVIFSGMPLRAAAPTLVHPNQGGDGVEYNPDTKRAAWWGGRGVCNGEIPSPALVSFASAATLSWSSDRSGMACGGLIEGLATDEAYLYFSQAGWLWRLPLGAPVNQPPTQLTLGVSQGYTPAAVTRLGDHLLWVESDGSFSKLWQAAGAGTGQQSLLLTGFWGPVHKLRVFYNPSIATGRSCCFLSDDGRLWKAALDPPGTATVLATGVKDFDVRMESIQSGSLISIFYRVFAAQGAQLTAMPLSSGASAVLYTPSAGHSVDAVAVDSGRVYLIESFTFACDPFLCDAYTLWRQDRPSDGSPPGLWVNFSAPVQNARVIPRSFHAAGQFLVWSDLLGVRSISADAPPVFLNFLAVGLEVVQTIQNLNNQVTLVAGKPTYVRAYARTDFNTTGNPTFFPSGVLNVSVWQPFPLAPIPLGTLNPIQRAPVDGTSDLQALRTALNRSFVFQLPPAWTHFPLLQCEFTVNPDRAYTENVGFDPYGDNTVTQTAGFLDGGEQCWVFVAVKNCVGKRYNPQVERNGADFWRIIDRAVSLMPIERSRVQVHTWADEIGPIGFDSCFNINNGGDWANIRAAMVSWSIFRSHPCDCERFIGTVDPSAVTGGGTTGIGGTCPFFANSSAVKMDPACRAPWNCPNGGVTLAHELGHNFCRSHVLCSGTEADVDAGYPYPKCTITIPNLSDPAAHYGFDPLSMSVVDPSANADLMSYGSRTWTSDYTWNALLAYGNGPCFPGHGGPALKAAQGGSLVNNYLVLTGTIDEQSERIQLFPAYVLPPDVVDPNVFGSGGAAGTQSSYSLRLADSQGNTLSVDPLVLQETDSHESTTIKIIAQTLPSPAGARTLQILHNGQVRQERFFSAHPPVLSLAPPEVDLTSQTLQCGWTAGDADGDPLVFAVQYSADNGASWIPLQAGSPATSLRVDLSALAGGPQARIRVIASDGLNCAVATSDPFVVPNNPPVAVVLGLQGGDRLPFGSLQAVTGMAHDHEDGVLGAALLQWTLSGPVSASSSGESLSVRDLPPGAYVATLSASDSGGLTASNSVAFEVLPLSVPDRPSPVVDGLCADAAYVDALEIPFNFGWTQPAYARLSHGDGALHVAFTGLPFSPFSGSPQSIGLVVDTDWSRDATTQTNDLGFFVDETGVPSQWHGDGAALVLNPQPSLGVQSAVFRGDNAWSAELSIPEALLGGWGHPAGLVIHLRDLNNVNVHTWPESASTARPQTWAPALFGIAPAASNRPPVAVVRAPGVQTIRTPELLVLDGTASFDPDGQPLTYVWTQLAGPSVTLSNAATATPSFVWSPASGTAEFRFRLVVNDGQLDSASADLDFTLYAVALNPQPLPPVQIDPASGTVSGALTWPGTMGDRGVIEASQDLKGWTPIATNTVDVDGRIHFRDPDANRHSQRFYRARGLLSTRLVVYQNDFESGLPVGPEWTPEVLVSATPIGSRHFLGQFGAQTISLTLNALPPHTRARVTCDLFIIGTWDGNNPESGPDRWQLQVRGGPTLVDATFSTYWNQSYPGSLGDQFPPRTGAAENDTLGYNLPGFGGADSVYHFDFSFDNSDAVFALDFSGIGLDAITKESWGLDNVVVEAINNP